MDVSVDPSGRILYVVHGALSDDRLVAFKESLAKAEATIKTEHAKSGKKVRILIDMSGFTDVYDVSCMEAFSEFARRVAGRVEKTAGYGGSLKARAAGDIVVALAFRDNIKFFSTKEEAEAWLDS